MWTFCRDGTMRSGLRPICQVHPERAVRGGRGQKGPWLESSHPTRRRHKSDVSIKDAERHAHRKRAARHFPTWAEVWTLALKVQPASPGPANPPTLFLALSRGTLGLWEARQRVCVLGTWPCLPRMGSRPPRLDAPVGRGDPGGKDGPRPDEASPIEEIWEGQATCHPGSPLSERMVSGEVPQWPESGQCVAADHL